jgi:SAM-dependent methyltransferase
MPEVSPTTAKKRARTARWLRGEGIEIGALHNPMKVGPEASVRYVDRLTNEELREQYPELTGEKLVHVDVVGDAHNLGAFADGSLDFVIANHLVEHLDDPIRGLVEMLRVLKPGGALHLAVPDPRNTFDHSRKLTTVDHLIDEFKNGTGGTRVEHFVDWVTNVEEPEGTAGQSQEERDARVRELMDLDYSIHFHVWRPDTFVELLIAIRNEAQVSFEIAEVLSCNREDDNEFIFVLLKGETPKPPEVPALPEEIELVGLKTELRHEIEKSENLRERLTARERELEIIYRSKSWNLTRPVRWLARRARQ